MMNQNHMINIETIEKADELIKSTPGLVYETPLLYSPAISGITGAAVYLKCEHLQQTGSFKLRGAAHKILSLDEQQKGLGTVTASSGNHGMGVALASRICRTRTTVYVPHDASPMKLETIRQYGAQIISVSGDCLQAELSAGQTARKTGKTYISPYNDLDVIAGQGTIGLEICEQEQNIDAVFIAVGGGGLISGIGSYIRRKSPDTRIIGCWPANSPALYECLNNGKIIDVDEKETLSDGTAGGVEENAVTFPICQKVIDDKILVCEDEIRHAMKTAGQHERFIIEGAAGVALAALMKTAGKFRGKKVVVVLCGRNILFEKYLKAVS